MGKYNSPVEKNGCISCFTCHSLHQQNSNTLRKASNVVLRHAYWVGASREKTSRLEKDEERANEREYGDWLTAQRGQRSVPWGYECLTPSQNEIDPLSEITSCHCLQGGKNFAWHSRREETELCVCGLWYRAWINILQSLAVILQAISLSVKIYSVEIFVQIYTRVILSALWMYIQCKLYLAQSFFRLDGLVWNLISVR